MDFLGAWLTALALLENRSQLVENTMVLSQSGVVIKQNQARKRKLIHLDTASEGGDLKRNSVYWVGRENYKIQSSIQEDRDII